MTGQFQFSVVIPTYNRAELLQRAIDSALKQTFPAHEIIVVDDGSTDNTTEVVKEYGEQVRYIWQENAGVSSARNRGIEESEGNVIAFLDSDDDWKPEKLKLQAKCFFEHDVSVCVTDSLEEGGPHSGKSTFEKSVLFDELRNSGPVFDAFPLLAQQNFINTSTVAAKKECFKKVGIFDETLKATEDTDLWLRLSVQYKFGMIHQNLGTRYLQDEGLSGDKELQYKGRVAIFNKLLKNSDGLSADRPALIKTRKKWILGRLLFYYWKEKRIGRLVSYFMTRNPSYLFSKMFYKGFYWDYKTWKNNRRGD